MKFKRFIRNLLPVSLIESFASIRQAWISRRIWEGIYADFGEVPSRYRKDHEEKYAQDLFDAMRALMEESRQQGTIPYKVIGEHNLLPLLAAAITEDRHALTILDFGGGMGISYIHLVNSLPFRDIQYHIVEVPAVCRKGSILFEGDPRVHFHGDFPADLGAVDVVFASSSLQYVPDFHDLIRRLCAYSPEYVFFVKLSAGDIPTYVSAQRNMPGLIVPYRFMNAKDLIAEMGTYRYELIYRGALERKYDQANFPQEFRLRQTCNLLFRSTTDGPVRGRPS